MYSGVPSQTLLIQCSVPWVQASISIRISPEFSADKAASGLEVMVPMPREVQRVNCDNLKPSQARPSSRSCLSRALISFTGFAAVHH